MARFVVSRLFQGVLVLLLMSFIIYGLIGLMPGDPIDLMVASNPKLTSADAARLRALYGIDRPIVERYGAWLRAAAEGDFGYSRAYNRPVLELLGRPLANTALLMLAGFSVALLIGIPAGIYSALHPHSRADGVVGALCFVAISMPTFWVAILLILLFAVVLGVLPASGMAIAGNAGVLERARHLILPVVTLALADVGSLARYTRAAMIETLRQDYVRTARAKGASTARVVFRHAFRNALIPVVTVVALGFGALFSGALITETMFAYPGMGKLIYDSIMGNDYNLALVALLFATLMTLVANLAADIGYAWLDPRISYARKGPA